MAYKSHKSKCFVFLLFFQMILATVVPADNNVAISVEFKMLWRSETVKQATTAMKQGAEGTVMCISATQT